MKCVTSAAAVLWDRTEIPHKLNDREGERMVSSVLIKCRELNKTPLNRRNEDFASDLRVLFDAANCHHLDLESCTCDPQHKVSYIYKW